MAKRRTATVQVRMAPEDAATVRAEAQRSGRSLSALLLAGAGRATGGGAVPGAAAVALPPELVALPARVEELARELAELRAELGEALAIETAGLWAELWAELRAELGNRRRGDRRGVSPAGEGVARLPQAPRAPTSRDLAGAAAGVSGRYVGHAKRLSADAPDLFAAVRAGTLTLPAAIREADRRGEPPATTATTTPAADDGDDVEPPPDVPAAPRRRPPPAPTAGTRALRAWREREGVSVGDLAERVGRPRGTVGAWLTGRQHPPPDARERLAELTGIAPATWGSAG